jgi:hypothetical protein
MKMAGGEEAECFSNGERGSACLGCVSGGIDLAGRASIFGRSGWT